MREDMKKVLTERPRTRGHWHNKRDPKNPKKWNYGRGKKLRINIEEFETLGFQDLEDLPKHESMMRKHHVGYGSKSFTDYLAPLYGFLRKNVGQKWDDVYSEVCKVVDNKTTTSRHLRDHVKMDVLEQHKCYFDSEGYLCNIYYNMYSRDDQRVTHRCFYIDSEGYLQEYIPKPSGRKYWAKMRESYRNKGIPEPDPEYTLGQKVYTICKKI